jgi:hypothetical protein
MSFLWFATSFFLAGDRRKPKIDYYSQLDLSFMGLPWFTS